MSTPLVIWHAGCWDGFCAAWLFHQVFPDAEHHAAHYGTEPPDCTGKDVYIADFSYNRPVMRQILSQAHKVVVLDHHKTAQAELDGLVDEFVQRPDLIANPPGSELPLIHFDMEKSGGRLAWEYLWTYHYGKKYSSISGDGTWFDKDHAPWLVDYTEDRDLWRWKLPHSRAINTALRSYPLDFAVWNEIANLQPDSFLAEGTAIMRREQQIIADHVRHAREIEMAGYKVLAVNATVLFSEIAGELAGAICGRCDGDGKAHGADRPFEWSGPGTYPGKCPICFGSGHRSFGVCWFDRFDGKRQWSLRSTDAGIDVSEIAKQFGGGGHKHAAGFETEGRHHAIR